MWEIFWNKLNGIGNDFSDGEFAFSSKGVQSRYFECSQFHNLSGGKDRIHPTEKPVKLYDWIYHNYLPQGGKVFDSHLGSGSNRIAADKAGNIDFYATEIDKDYFDAQEKRFKEYKQQLVIQF